MDFTVTYEPTPDEVARALEQGVRQQLRTTYLILPLVLVASGLICILVDATYTGTLMLVLAVVFPFVLNWSIRRTGKRQLTYLCVPTTIRLTDDGYEARSDHFTSATQWSLFGRIVTGPEFWLFFVNKQFTGFLSRRAFNGEQQAEFDAFLASRQSARVT
ncbi:YcxB family protein [Streptosporangium longisporum]|uniref:YcxB-like C-terminal domain-containing protein n=1 Tax=Streptosporangium longisporum TaxID=46187 RepID=A0ABN3XWG1_9ACTN